MVEKLDKDFNPVWLCKAAGLLFPFILLLASIAWNVVYAFTYVRRFHFPPSHKEATTRESELIARG